MRVQTGADSSVADRTQVRDRMRMAAIPRMIMGNRAPMTTTTRARNMALRRQIRLMIHWRRAVCARRRRGPDAGSGNPPDDGRSRRPPTDPSRGGRRDESGYRGRGGYGPDGPMPPQCAAPDQYSNQYEEPGRARRGPPSPQIIAMDARQSHAASHRPMMIGTAARAMMTGMVMIIAGSNLRRARAMTVACHRTSQHGINR